MYFCCIHKFEKMQLAVTNQQSDIAAAFMADQDVMGSSKATYGRTLDRYLKWMKGKGYKHDIIQREHILEYKMELLEGGHSPLTVGSYLTAVRKFYAWAEAKRYIFTSPAKDIKTPKKRQTFEKETLTTDETKRLNQYYKNKPLRDYAIATLVQLTGLRCIEVTRLNIEDITMREGERVLLIQGKGRDEKDEAVVLTDEAYRPIMEYLNTRMRTKAGEPLFISCSDKNKGGRLSTRFVSGLLKEGLRSIGLDDRRYTAHSLRHTVGTAIYELSGGDIYQVQLALRHRNPATSQIYARKAMQKAGIKNSPLKMITIN